MNGILQRSSFLIALTLAGAVVSHSYARTVSKARAARSSSSVAKPGTAAGTNPAQTQSGAVLINSITRNRSVSKVTLQLARDGNALLPVVISEKASPGTQAVARELAEYLGRIAGATFEVRTGDGTAGIVLGNMADFPTPALGKALQIVNGHDGKEAFAIRTRESKVLLLGATDLGTSHAAYRFLDELGVRWFWPNKAWEVVPEPNPNLTWNLDITDRPSVLSRVIWFEAGSGTANAEKEYTDWKRRNLQAESFRVNAGHNLDVVTRVFAEEFKAHPEYYAVDKDGKRMGDDVELTNPAVRKLIVEYARRFFKDNPQADMVSIDPVDTAFHSQRPEALKNPYSDQIFSVANEVARMLQKEFPGKMVGLYSYNAHYDPPSFKLEPNVHVQLTSMSVAPRYSPAERNKLWPQRSSNLGVYEYYSVFAWSNDNLPGSYTNGVRGYQKHVKENLVGRNIVAMSAESTSAWGVNSRGYYFATRYLWNPDFDLNAALKDYYEKAFGPAAEPMERYYERLSPDNNPLMSGHLLGLALRDLNEATTAAQNNPDVLARIDQIKLYLRYVDLMWRRHNEGLQVNDADIMGNLFRTREFALTSWELIRQQWGGGKYPGQPDAPAWMVDKAHTREEIEADFQDALKFYEPKIRQVGERVKFSTGLVPVKWPGTTPKMAVESNHIYQGSMKYALWSFKGEPLEFTTTADDAWGYKTSFTVTDSEGKEIASGKPEPKQAIAHKIKVPKPGIYYLNYNDPGAYWTFKSSPGRVATVIALPEETGGRSARINQDWYFYVPNGVRTLEYFTQGGSAHTVIGPDGSEQAKVLKLNDFVTIPVPVGMDGKLWRLNQAHFGKFHFLNAPSYFAGSPDALLVPREVAQRDGLQIRK